MAIRVIRYSERPELWEDTAAVSHEVRPEYNLHGEDPFPYDNEAQAVIAEGHTIPCDWDETAEGLGDGISAMVAAAFAAKQAGRQSSALWAES